MGWKVLLFLTRLLGGMGKNSIASVASYPALTFFLKKVLCILGAEVKYCFNLNKLLHGTVLVVAAVAALNVQPVSVN